MQPQRPLLHRLPLIAALFSAAALVGCASSVPLDTPPPAAQTVPLPSAGSATQRAAEGTDPGATTSKEIAAAKAAIDRVKPSVYFDFDSFIVKSEYQPVVSAFANYLRADARARLVIEGHADDRGTSEYNLALGQKRSEAVKRALGVLGIAESRIEAVSFGEEKPRAQGATEAAWAENRRGDLVLR